MDGVAALARSAATGDADGVLVEDVARRDRGRDDALDAGEKLAVALGGRPAARVRRGDVRQLHAEQGRLERVQPRVVADGLVVVLPQPAVSTQAPRLGREALVVGRDEPCVAEGAEVLGREERVAARCSERPRLPAGERRPVAGVAARSAAARTVARVDGAERLRAVLDERGARVLGNRREARQLRDAAVEVDGQDGPRPLGHDGLDRVGVQHERRLVHVGEDGRGAEERDGLGGRKERERARHDLVARADAERAERDHERVRARVEADRVADAEKLSRLALERLDLRPADEHARARHALERGRHFGPERVVLRREVENRDVRHSGVGHERRGASRSSPARWFNGRARSASPP